MRPHPCIPCTEHLGLRASWPGTPQGPVTAYTEKAPRAKAWSLVRFGALLAFFFFLILYFIWLRQVLAVARWDLVPWPGIKSMPPAVEAVLNTAPPREAPANFFKEEWWRLWKVRSHIIWVTKDAEDGGEGKMIIESYFFSVALQHWSS